MLMRLVVSPVCCNMVALQATWLDSEIRCHSVAIEQKVMAEAFQENPAAPKKRKAEPKPKEKLTDRRLKALKPADKPYRDYGF